MSDFLTELRREHRKAYRSASDETWDRHPLCLVCRAPWPCDAAKAADEIERLRAEVAELVQVLSETATAHDDLACEHEAAVDADAAARCRAVLRKHQGVLGDE